MLSFVSCLIAVAGAILLLFFKSSFLKEIKATAIFVSAIVLLASIFLLFPKTHESAVEFGGVVYFGSDFFSALASIVVAFLTLLCLVATVSKGDENLGEFAETESFLARKYYVSLLLLEGLYILLFSSQNLIISALILLVAITLLYFMTQKTDKKIENIALKTLAFRITGTFLLILASIFNGFVEESSLDIYFFLVGIIFILPMLPVHTYLSDMFAGIGLKDGLATIILQLVGFYMLLSFSTAHNVEISSIAGFWIVLVLINLFVIVLASRSQLCIYRQFSYLMVFFSGMVAFLNFALIDSISALNTVKYLALSIPLILSFAWICINQLRIFDESGSFSKLSGKLSGDSFSINFIKSTFIVSFLFIVGIPFTPVFNAIVKTAGTFIAMDYTVSIIFIPFNTTSLLILLLFAFLLHVLNFANTLQKLCQKENPDVEKPENISPTTPKEIFISRNFVFISISVLILILVLSILPVFFFRKLHEDTQKIQNVSGESQSKTLEINSSEGLNEK
ncbi:MAG: hypothetical protein K8S87_07230 [Planctomycetes bacterium]|nr:hypothetical protein [Planctomycetota bacterium]